MFLVQEYSPLCVGGYVYMCECLSKRACVCLFSHFPFLISHVCGFTDSRAHLTRAEAWLRPTQTCGWRQWLRKEEEGWGGQGEGRELRGGQKQVEGIRDGMSSPHSPKVGDEQLAMNTWVAASLSTHADTQEQLKIAKQRPSTTSANYLAESGPGPRIRVVPAVGLDWRMALIETVRDRREKTWWEKLSITDKGLYNKKTGSQCDRRIDQSVINT